MQQAQQLSLTVSYLIIHCNKHQNYKKNKAMKHSLCSSRWVNY